MIKRKKCILWDIGPGFKAMLTLNFFWFIMALYPFLMTIMLIPIDAPKSAAGRRFKSDPKFARALYAEAVSLLRGKEVQLGLSMMNLFVRFSNLENASEDPEYEAPMSEIAGCEIARHDAVENNSAEKNLLENTTTTPHSSMGLFLEGAVLEKIT